MARQYPSTCLSERPHDHCVSDITTHYNGCLRAPKRRKFFDSLTQEAQNRIVRDNDKIAELRHRLETAQYDSTAGARLRSFKQAMTQWAVATSRPRASYGPDSRRPSEPNPYFGSDDLVNDYIKAPVMYFKDGRPHDVPGLPGQFPRQKVPMSDLLADDIRRNPIMQPCDDDVVRYFHLPANNMVWVEEVMARYYHEKRPQLDDMSLRSKYRRARTRTETLLRPEYWQGQQNFEADAEVHARHMRPFCDRIAVDSSVSPKNLALFMPYLHWETDRGRVKSAEIIKEVHKQMPRSMSEVVNQAQNLAHTHTQDTTAPVWVAPQEAGQPSLERADRRRALGQLLRAAAALSEAMDVHTEEQLMMRYLHAQPPLHPRRTLDQSYYGALKSTRARDRDQVVYRATNPEPHDCIGMDECQQCNEDVRKVPRIIMVDQLWLWILDEKTVVTSFPRRFGKNRPDPSAIHKSLRNRILDSLPGDISTAYDLALVIIDECSRVFFDRAKTDDRKPNLIESFAGAIRDLTYKQTAAFDQFLIYTHLASRDYKREQPSTAANNSTQNTLLNINPEGNLLKEVKDVVDEIHIMLRIKDQQLAVLSQLTKHIRHTLSPLTHHKKKPLSQVSTAWDLVLGDAMSDDPEPDPESEILRLKAQHTLSLADHVLSDLQSRISELASLLQIASNTSSALKDILTLKQQQASVIEAREAVKQAQLTLKQGQSIMIFTIVTIIFLPLSFCVGLFGMNNIEFNEGLLPIATEFKIMFPVSAAITLIAFVFAFSQGVLNNSLVALASSMLSYVWNGAVTWLAVKSGLYMVGREMERKARRLREEEGRVTGGMKAEVMRREKNLERMRGVGSVKALHAAKRKEGGEEGRRLELLSPYTPGLEGGGFGKDVEMGERRHTGMGMEPGHLGPGLRHSGQMGHHGHGGMI